MPYLGEIPTLKKLSLHFPPKGIWSKIRSIWRVWGMTHDIQQDGINIFHGLSNELPLNIGTPQQRETKLGEDRCKYLVTIHDLIFIHTPQYYHWIDRKIYNYKFRRACQCADRVIAVSEYTKQEIMHYYHTPEEKIDVVYQGCDPVFAQDIESSKQEEVKQKYQLPDQYVLYVGSIEERKNLMLVAKAMAEINQMAKANEEKCNIAKIHVVAVGRRTPYVDEIQAYLKEKAQLQSQRDCYKKERDEERESHSQTKKELAKAKEEITKLQESKEAKELSEQANVDLHSVVLVLQRRLFKTNSDASSYMKGEVEFDERRMNDMEFTDVVDEANKLASGIIEEVDQTPVDTGKEPKLPKSDKRKEKKDKEDKPKRRRNVFSIKVLDSMGIDTSNLPAGFKLIHRKNKITGEDVWIVRMYDCYAPLAGCIEYEIGRFNVPGHDPMCSKHPDHIVGKNPLLPSFARFYLDMKIHYNVSENRILEMLRDMEAFMPQSSLNKWMHEIMKCLRERLQDLMLEVIKSSIYTNNDETRILVRNLLEDKPDKYKVEYIHAALSLEKKLVVMLYGEGSRSHTIPEEQIFEHSNIKYFTADRAKLYDTVVKSIEEKYGVKITRTACWFHARHYFVDAFIADHRVRPIIKLMNYLFYIERVADEKGKTGEARLKFRLKYSRFVVQSIMKALQRMKDEKDVKKYGKMVMRAVNYVLDDKEAFQVFLTNGDVEIHNIAIERCFRHIAMGRRNWGKAGSHEAAENLAFMYSLYESCKMNNLNFGRYIEDILTRMKDGDKDYKSMLPCYYVEKSDEVKECA